MAKSRYEEWIEPEGLIKLQGWAKMGLTDQQIFNNMGIASKTFYTWQQKYPQIKQALKKGKEVVDFQVENALFKRAVGYAYNEVTKELVMDKESGEPKLTTTKIVKKEVPPDTTAIMAWLNNRKPNEWRKQNDLDIRLKEAQIAKLESEVKTAETTESKVGELFDALKGEFEKEDSSNG